ncbi:MAG: hypothetical protein AAF961_16960, partial [Planctomycetota bacterium]
IEVERFVAALADRLAPVVGVVSCQPLLAVALTVTSSHCVWNALSGDTIATRSDPSSPWPGRTVITGAAATRVQSAGLSSLPTATEHTDSSQSRVGAATRSAGRPRGGLRGI